LSANFVENVNGLSVAPAFRLRGAPKRRSSATAAGGFQFGVPPNCVGYRATQRVRINNGKLAVAAGFGRDARNNPRDAGATTGFSGYNRDFNGFRIICRV
jgi:hypothetical protein